MTNSRIPANRGPAAAAENRAALIRAARELFATDGYSVPLSRIAERAQVGRASLYRHFPTRLDLGWAIFHDNLAKLAALSKSSDDAVFYAMWRKVVIMTVENSALVEMVVAAADTTPTPPIPDLAEIFAEPLQRVQRRGQLTTLVPADLSLIVRMLWGVIVSEPDADKRELVVERALELLCPELSIKIEPNHDPYT